MINTAFTVIYEVILFSILLLFIFHVVETLIENYDEKYPPAEGENFLNEIKKALAVTMEECEPLEKQEAHGLSNRQGNCRQQQSISEHCPAILQGAGV